VICVREEGSALDESQRREADGVIGRLVSNFGYCRSCAGDAATLLVRRRFHDLVV
jgi:hypothetical protein